MAVVSNTGAAVHGGLSVHVRPVIGVSIVASLMKMQMWCVFTVKIDYDSLLPWLTPKSFMTIYVRRKYQTKMSNKWLSQSVIISISEPRISLLTPKSTFGYQKILIE